MAEMGPRSAANLVFIAILAVFLAGALFFTVEMIRDAMTLPAA